MKVAIVGGTGFVGSHVVDALVEAEHTPRLLVRPGHESRVRHPEHVELASGDVADGDALASLLQGADAVIYLIGILRELPLRGITFEALQQEGAMRVIDAARAVGVGRFLLMSANGVRTDGTPYQRTKALAEEYLAESGLDWTVFRPSVIFGPPRGRMEFATQLCRDLIGAPLPGPLFFPGMRLDKAGTFELSPVHVQDVATAFRAALESPETIGRILHLGGPEALTWRAILDRLAHAVHRRKLLLPVPALGVQAAAALLDRFEQFPITRDQIRMLLEGNTCPPDDLLSLGITPRPFDDAHLDYLNQNQDSSSWQQNAA